MSLKKIGSPRGLTFALLSCGLSFDPNAKNEGEMSQKVSR